MSRATKRIERQHEYIKERVRAGRDIEIIGAMLMLALLSLSLRNVFANVIGSLLSLFILVFAFYSYKRPRNRYIKMRAKYFFFFALLSIFAYYGSHAIPKGDITLMTSLAGALVTATSISAVFAGTIYEKMKETTLRNRKSMPEEVIDLTVRLAIYPIIISILALFASILALVFSASSFVFSIILVNVAITFVLLALITSVEFLKEDLLRQLN